VGVGVKLEVGVEMEVEVEVEDTVQMECGDGTVLIVKTCRDLIASNTLDCPPHLEWIDI